MQVIICYRTVLYGAWLSVIQIVGNLGEAFRVLGAYRRALSAGARADFLRGGFREFRERGFGGNLRFLPEGEEFFYRVVGDEGEGMVGHGAGTVKIYWRYIRIWA